MAKIGKKELKVATIGEFNISRTDGHGKSNNPSFESEDTLSILNRYIQEAEIQLDKSRVQNIMRKTYQEACELI